MCPESKAPLMLVTACGVESLLFLREDVDHPVNAELVGDHAERVPPELLRERHVNLSSPTKLGEHLSEFAAVLTAEAHVDVVAEHHFLARLSVAGHYGNSVILQS